MASLPKLDRNSPTLGTINPPYNGAQFVMGDHYFAGNGTYLFSQEGGDGKRYSVKADAEKPAKPEPDQTPAETDGEPETNIVAWAKGEQKAEWFKIKKAAKALDPNLDISNAGMLKSSLVALGYVDAGAVKK